MADHYKSEIDRLLADNMPDFEEVQMAGAEASGKDQLERTHQYQEEDFLDGLTDISEVDSYHTMLPGGGRGGKRTGSQQSEDRVRDQESSMPRLSASKVINRTARALSDESAFSDVVMDLEKAKGYGFNDKREISNEEVQAYIKKMLNHGVPPVKIQAALNKMAELQLFQHNMATDYLNHNAGLLGIAYLQPNDFMDKCPTTYERLKVKGAGKIQAKSVKQIQACEGCMFFKKDAGQKTCNLYHLPVISSQNELLTVVNKMTAGVPANQKKAALVKIANHEPERTPMINHVVSSRPSQKVVNTSPSQARDKQKRASFELTAGHIEKLHNAGNTLEKIYAFASKKVGTANAGRAVREFVASLKEHHTKIALSQIDCTFLKQKLGVQNAIVGAAKCGSCVFRKNMHCGLTGGTLLSFPGMEKQASNHKIAANAPKDGKAMLQEFDLTVTSKQEDIDIYEPKKLDVQMRSVMSSGDLE